MADNKLTDHNATPVDDKDALRGGTQGGRPDPIAQVGSMPGGTNAISPAGSSEFVDKPAHAGDGTRTDSREDSEELFEGTRKPSHAEAKQRARDDANVDTAARTPHGAGEPRAHAIHGDR